MVVISKAIPLQVCVCVHFQTDILLHACVFLIYSFSCRFFIHFNRVSRVYFYTIYRTQCYAIYVFFFINVVAVVAVSLLLFLLIIIKWQRVKKKPTSWVQLIGTQTNGFETENMIPTAAKHIK